MVFWVETEAEPVEGAHASMLEYRQFKAWPEGLIARLKYDHGSLLRQEMEQLGFATLKRRK